MEIHLYKGKRNWISLSLDQLIGRAPRRFPIANRVPELEGTAFDFKSWYAALEQAEEGAPTHLRVEASDKFQATIPWNQLDQAAILFEQKGEPLKKGYPLRLYVPDGSSHCLNVKSIVKMYFLIDESLGEEATFGFKNTISLDEMKNS